MVELLKQPQYKPMDVIDQVMSHLRRHEGLPRQGAGQGSAAVGGPVPALHADGAVGRAQRPGRRRRSSTRTSRSSWARRSTPSSRTTRRRAAGGGGRDDDGAREAERGGQDRAAAGRQGGACTERGRMWFRSCQGVQQPWKTSCGSNSTYRRSITTLFRPRRWSSPGGTGGT